METENKRMKKEERVNQWLENFAKEIKVVETEFRSFFAKKKIQEYYKVNVDNEIGFISVQLLNREQIPIEIIDAITVALLRAKPLFKSTE